MFSLLQSAVLRRHLSHLSHLQLLKIPVTNFWVTWTASHVHTLPPDTHTDGNITFQCVHCSHCVIENVLQELDVGFNVLGVETRWWKRAMTHVHRYRTVPVISGTNWSGPLNGRRTLYPPQTVRPVCERCFRTMSPWSGTRQLFRLPHQRASFF